MVIAIQFRGDAEVNYLQLLLIAAEEYIRWLQVLVDYQIIVKELDAGNQLAAENFYTLYVYGCRVGFDVRLQVAAAEHLHYHVDLMHPCLGSVLAYQVLILQNIWVRQIMHDEILVHVGTKGLGQ